MKLKKILKIGLPFLGLSAVAVVMPVTLTSCSQKDNTNYISMDQAQANKIHTNLAMTLSQIKSESDIAKNEQSLKNGFNYTSNGLSIATYVKDVKITLLDSTDSTSKKKANVTITLAEGYSVKVLNDAKIKFNISNNVLTSSSPYTTGITPASETEEHA